MGSTLHFFPGEEAQEAINRMQYDSTRPVAAFEKKKGAPRSSKKQLKTKSTQVKTPK